MNRAKLLAVCIVGMLAVSAGAAASASAAPEFLHLSSALTLTSFKGKSSGPVTLADPALTSTLHCTKEEVEGEIEFGSTKHVEEVIIKFKGCTDVVPITGKLTKCPVKSPGQPSGTVRTRRLDGDLGEVAAAEAADEVGLDLKPEVGTVVMVVQPTTCAIPTVSVEGSVIGEVTPKGPPEGTEKKLLSTTFGLLQRIQKLGSAAPDTLKVLATEVTLTSSVTLKFAEALEVT